MDCFEDLATPAPELADTQVALRMLSQNPARGEVAFAATLPGRAALRLEIVDLRGRRVRLLERRDVEAGTHVFRFDGRDDRGAALANATYLARLSVAGSGVSTTRVQRFVWLD
jgi:hypothetical protein